MKPDLTRWSGADELLDAALGLPAEDRIAHVRRHARDPELAAALEAVLAEAAGDDGFLDPGGAWSGSLGEELRDVWQDAPALTAGARIEHYDIGAPIGRGGMGEVYRARDTRLNRDVAVKVLPVAFARDPERRARFRREAQALASLNHPGIAAIYGVAEADGIEALVLELVEGPTLAERIADGPLPLDELLLVSRQLADALTAAHDRGILHRDLKPANIKIAPSAKVKVLDFGLARMLAPAGVPSADADLTRAGAGALIGTASYMSPEQARGRPIDDRTDIWAFGCVLFEMLTGTRAFSGASTTDVLAAVIEREPAFGLLPPGTPEPLRRLLRRCLEKDPERRLGYIGDARLEIEEAALPQMQVLEPVEPAPASWWKRGAVLLAAGLLAGAAAASWLARPRPVAPAPVARLVMPLPPGDQPATGFQPMPALSPDGRTIVYRARRGETTMLFRRDLEALQPVALAGTEAATSPFFSPDGRWLGFDGDGVLKRISPSGGTPVPICDAPGGVTAAWLPDDTIVFATNTTRVLQRVPAAGGTPQAITTLDAGRGDTMHLLPQALPGGRAVLFTIVAGATRQVAVLDLETGEIRPLADGTHGRYLDGGYIVFGRDGVLWGARFDVERLALTGPAVPLDERVAHTDNTVFHFAATGGGPLVYLAPQAVQERQRIVWIDRSGRETPVDLDPRPYQRVALAPDGRRIAVALEEDGNTDIWVADPARRTLSRLTLEPSIETMPTWTPDGRFVTFRSEREGPGVFRREWQGTGTAERLTVTDGPIHSPYSWTPDGRTLLVALFRSFRQQAIGSVTPPDTGVRILLDGDFAQLDPQISPDGRWMAYQSDETGRFEVYVRPYPEVDSGRWVISTGGGTSPRWGPDGREIFYFDGEWLARAAVTTGARFAAARPARLFEVRPFTGRLGPDYEVSPDGRRFLFLLPGPAGAPASSSLVVVLNWVEELRARLAAAP